MYFVGKSLRPWPLELFQNVLCQNDLMCHDHNTKLASRWDYFDTKNSFNKYIEANTFYTSLVRSFIIHLGLECINIQSVNMLMLGMFAYENTTVKKMINVYVVESFTQSLNAYCILMNANKNNIFCCKLGPKRNYCQNPPPKNPHNIYSVSIFPE